MKTSKQLSFSPRQQGAVLIFSLVILLLLTLLGVNMIQQNRLQFMMAANAQQQTETFAAAEDLLAVEEAQIYTWHANYSPECRTPTPKAGTKQCQNGGGQPVDCLMPDGVTSNPAAKTATVTYEYGKCYSYSTTTRLYDTEIPNKKLENVGFSWTLSESANPVVPDKKYPCYKTGGLYTQLQAADVNATGRPPWTLTTNTLGLNSDNIGTTEVSIVSVACMTDTGSEAACDYDADGNLSSSNLYCHGDPAQDDLTQCPEENANYNCRSAVQTDCPTELYTLRVVTRNNTTSAQRTVESKYAVRCDNGDVGEMPTP